MNHKHWWKSKTIWLSLCEIVVGGIFVAKDVFAESGTVGVVMIIAGVVQAVLRKITNTGI